MKQKNRKNKESIILALLIVFTIILIFTAIDYYIHSLSEEYSAPSYYFKNKIIFGTLIGFITYISIKNRIKTPLIKSLMFSSVISILLQIRYYLEGYPKIFVFEFLFIHFIILFLVSFAVFSLSKNF